MARVRQKVGGTALDPVSSHRPIDLSIAVLLPPHAYLGSFASPYRACLAIESSLRSGNDSVESGYESPAMAHPPTPL
jgi:hypothetical protein